MNIKYSKRSCDIVYLNIFVQSHSYYWIFVYNIILYIQIYCHLFKTARYH